MDEAKKPENYKTLLKLMADFGHGVFTITMLEDTKQRDALKHWIYRNPSLFVEQKGGHGDVKICALTREGMRKFEAKDTVTASKSWASFVDMALVNAFMLERNSFTRYSNSAHADIEIDGLKVGLLSPRWGLAKNFLDVDVLLTLSRIRDEFLNESATTVQLARKYSLSHSEFIDRINSAIVPKALAFTR